MDLITRAQGCNWGPTWNSISRIPEKDLKCFVDHLLFSSPDSWFLRRCWPDHQQSWVIQSDQLSLLGLHWCNIIKHQKSVWPPPNLASPCGRKGFSVDGKKEILQRTLVWMNNEECGLSTWRSLERGGISSVCMGLKARGQALTFPNNHRMSCTMLCSS